MSKPTFHEMYLKNPEMIPLLKKEHRNYYAKHYPQLYPGPVTRFRFVIGNEVCEFNALENDKSIREKLEKKYPDCTLELKYCQCADMGNPTCNCVDGHFISTSRWISPDPLKPWIGTREEYNVPLEVVDNRGGSFRYWDDWR